MNNFPCASDKLWDARNLVSCTLCLNPTGMDAIWVSCKIFPSA
jgi:hypothetical protein